MPTTKLGEKISWKEAGKRFKQGIEGITPIQQLKIQIQGTWISILGIILGIIVNMFFLKNFWWIIVILIGAVIVTGISQIGQYQKYWAMKEIESRMKLLEAIETNVESTTTNFINTDNLINCKGEKEDDKILEEKK